MARGSNIPPEAKQRILNALASGERGFDNTWIPNSQGQGVALNGEGQAQAISALEKESPGSVPYQVPNMSGPPQQRSPTESQGSQGGGQGGAIASALGSAKDYYAGILDQWAQVPEDVKQEGAVGAAGDLAAETLGPVGAAYDFGKEFLFGGLGQDEGQQGASQKEQARKAAMDYEIEASGQASGQAGSGGQTSSSAITIPQRIIPSGEEAYPARELPTMDGGMKQEQMERLKALAPEEFEREDASMAEVLGSMGQSLGQLGRAPGLGQALLALGTGSSQAVAANEAEQDRLARQHAQRQRAFDQMLAQKSNQLDQQILQGKRRQYQADRELEKLRQQQDNARAQMLNQMSQVQAQGDKIRITTPVQDDEGNFAGQLKTRVIDTSGPEARQRLDYLTGRIDEDTTSHGTVGSKNVNDEMKGLNPQEKQTHAVTAPLVDGRRLMVPGMEKRRQELNQKGEDMVRQRYGIEGDVPLGRAARTLDVSYEELQDQIEEQAWALHMQEFQSNRLYRAASLEATNIGPYVEQGREEHEHWKKQQGEG